MPQLRINIPVENIATIIKSMDEGELETLCLLLSDQAKELQERKNEFESGQVRLISRDEVFDI